MANRTALEVTLRHQLEAVTQQRDEARAELEELSSNLLKLWRKHHTPTQVRDVCGSCQHRHLSKVHGNRCPHCPCAAGGEA